MDLYTLKAIKVLSDLVVDLTNEDSHTLAGRVVDIIAGLAQGSKQGANPMIGYHLRKVLQLVCGRIVCSFRGHRWCGGQFCGDDGVRYCKRCHCNHCFSHEEE